MARGRHHLLVVFILALALLPAAAKAESDAIYAYAGDDGTLNLSNVPTTGRYKRLLGDASAIGAGASVRRHRTRVRLDQGRFDRQIEDTAQACGVDSALLHAVVAAESGYDPGARSPKGAQGLMQLMPGTARRYGVADAFDPSQNLQGGALYLKDLLKQYGNDLTLTLAAYNAGEQAVAKYGSSIPPYPETAAYVPRVLKYYRQYKGDDHGLE